MKVKELIEELSKLNQEKTIVVWCPKYDKPEEQICLVEDDETVLIANY